jgi:hypothetical protein
MHPLRSLARSAHAGRLAYYAWHRPVGLLRDCIREGGPLEQRRTAAGMREMEAAAARLEPPAAGDPRPLAVHLLTGRRFWFQTAFCLHSLATRSGRALRPVIYDDGSLEAGQAAALRRLFPAASIRSAAESVAGLDAFLPRGRFPVLRERWDNYPNIRKLVDPHLNSSGWKLVMDSDLLFFRAPDLLASWCDAPSAPLHAVDVASSYGYPRELMDSLAGAPVADLVNVGLCGLESGALDWPRIEGWCRALQERGGRSYYLEQALVAMLVAGRPCTVAPAADYVTLPRPPEAVECRAVMHHYVAESKRWYFQLNWRRAAPASP